MFVGSTPDSLCSMQALRVLYLNNNELTGTTLDLHNPYTICIAYIPLSTRYTVGAIPADISKLTCVTALNFDENKLTGRLSLCPLGYFVLSSYLRRVKSHIPYHVTYVYILV